jgi:ribonuclease HI
MRLDKSFPSEEDAKAFVAGKNPTATTGKGGVKEPDKYYAVARGNKTGIFTDWETASQAVAGAKMPKYKKFGTLNEANAFMKQWQGNNGSVNVFAEGTGKFAAPKDAEEEEEEEDGRPAKKAKTTAQDSADADGEHQKAESLEIYTDGSCIGNGIHGAVAGVGVWFGRADPRYGFLRLPLLATWTLLTFLTDVATYLSV